MQENSKTKVTDGDTDNKTTVSPGVGDFTDKPADLTHLTEKIGSVFEVTKRQGKLYQYGSFARTLKKLLATEGIILGDNGLGIKCFCRDDNQDRLAYLLMKTCSSNGWFDLNSFGAYPAGRSIESFGPPSHHIPELGDKPWTVIFHATHVGCDSSYTLGLTHRYNMQQPTTSCGLLAAILKRHEDRCRGNPPPSFQDFEMRETENALIPFLEEIAGSPYPMAAAAELLFNLGQAVFDSLLKFSNCRSFYIGGINVDYNAESPENNLFVPKTIRLYEDGERRELPLP